MLGSGQEKWSSEIHWGFIGLLPHSNLLPIMWLRQKHGGHIFHVYTCIFTCEFGEPSVHVCKGNIKCLNHLHAKAKHFKVRIKMFEVTARAEVQKPQPSLTYRCFVGTNASRMCGSGTKQCLIQGGYLGAGCLLRFHITRFINILIHWWKHPWYTEAWRKKTHLAKPNLFSLFSTHLVKHVQH